MTKIYRLCLLSVSILSSASGGNVAIENPQVVSGQVSFDGLQSNTATITQHSNKAIVDYQRFDVLAGGAVNFDQPSAQAAILNRIQSADPSLLNGSITGNGQIYFVNPAGVTFGPNSIIRADTFMAVAGQIANEDFLAGQLQFDLQGTVSNYGLIETLNDVALLGKQVINAGDIVSKSGVSILSAGDEVLLRENGSSLAVQLSTVDAPSEVGVAIDNSGTVEGDEVMFSAGDTYSLALRQSGTVRAAKSAKLYADDGAIEVSGKVSAQSDAGAGRIEIGGTDRGGNSAPVAAEVLITETAVLDASAFAKGDGGHVVVYSSGTTEMYGGLYAEGNEGGNGGFAEISGEQLLLTDGIWDIRLGSGGSLLFDPVDFTIDAIEAANLVSKLNDGTSLIVETDGTGGNGDIFVNADIIVSNDSAAGTLTLDADRHIIFNNDGVGAKEISSNQIFSNASDNIFVLKAGGDIIVDGAISASSITNLGAIRLTAGGDITVNSTSAIFSKGSNLVLTAENDVQILGQLGASSELSEVTATSGSIELGGSAFFEIRNTADLKLTAKQFINLSGADAISQQGSGSWQVVLPYLFGATADANPHTYGGLKSDNYAVYGSSGTAGVTQNEYHFGEVPVLVVSVNNDSKTYGDDLADANYQGYTLDPSSLISAASFGSIFLQDTELSSIITGSVVLHSTGAVVTADAGTYDLTAAGFASSNGYDFNLTKGEFSVQKRAITVTADSRKRIYGDALELGTVTSGFTYEDTHEGVGDTELPNGDSLTIVTLGSKTSAATLTADNVGVYADEVTVDALVGTTEFKASNYELTPVSGDLEVLKREITVTALEQTKVYANVESFGSTLHSLDGTKFSVTDLDADAILPNGESIVLTTMNYEYGTDLGKSTVAGVGTTAAVININGVTGANDFDLDNYTISFANGDYRIDARPITLTALGQSKQYGVNAALLDTEFSVLDDQTSGAALPNGELIDTVVVGSTALYAVSTTQGVGTYADDLAISALGTTSSGFNQANYAVSYVAGDYTIDPRAVTLTATQQSKIYGNTMTLDGASFAIADLDSDALLPNGELIDSVSLVSVNGVDVSTTADAEVHVDEIRINGQSGSAGFNANNYAFTYEDGNLLVTKRPISVTALEQAKVYGNVESFSGTVDSLDGSQFSVTDLDSDATLPNGETIASTTMSYAYGDDLGQSTTAAAGTTTAVIAIDSVTGANDFDLDNYTISFANGDYRIDARPITLTALGQSKQYGVNAALLDTEFSVLDDQTSGAALPNGELIDTVVVGSTALYAVSTTQGVGTYADDLAISALGTTSSGFNQANYAVSYVAGDYTIDPRAVTLTATQQSKIYGNTMTLDGASFAIADLDSDALLPNGELIDSVSLVSVNGVDVSTTADAEVHVDEIRINGQSGSAGFNANNYAFTYEDGNLLVTKRPISVTALDQAKIYGESVGLTNSSAFSLEDITLSASLPNGELIGSVDLLSGNDNGGTAASVGSYADDLSINVLNGSNGFELSNYEPTYVAGDFEVNRRSIAISLLDQSKPYGEPYTFDSGAFTVYDSLSDTSNLPNTDQVVGITFQEPALDTRTAEPGTYESLLQGKDPIGANGFDSANYAITFNPADLIVTYINDIGSPVVSGEAHLDQQNYVYSGSPFAPLFNPTPPMSANGFSSIVERPEWTSMTPEQQVWIFAQVAQINGATELSEEFVEYLIAGAKAQ